MDNTKRVTWLLTSLRRFLTGLIQSFRQNIARISTQAFLLAYGMPNPSPPILLSPYPGNPVPRSVMPISLSSIEDDDKLSEDATFFARTRPHLYLAMVRVHILEHLIDSGMRAKQYDWNEYNDWKYADITLTTLQYWVENERTFLYQYPF